MIKTEPKQEPTNLGIFSVPRKECSKQYCATKDIALANKGFLEDLNKIWLNLCLDLEEKELIEEIHKKHYGFEPDETGEGK